ncbi:MAG TPA: ABC transporter permease, partial [Candidatus Limnocylindria bacterium]|nr:ABC transporter permease [Candidatus Limnocylindria bacterium]
MTATPAPGSEGTATDGPPEAQHPAGLAARRDLRNARIRGATFVALALVAFGLASTSFETSAVFSFWIDRQGGESASLGTTVGVLWIVAGLVSGLVGFLQLVKGAAFRWRPWLLLLVVPYVAVILAALLDGTSANLTGVLGGSLELAVPISMGALAGILSERSGMLNIALEGKMLVGAAVAAIASSVALVATANVLLSTLIGIAAAMTASGALGLLLAWLGIRHKVDQIIAGTVINIGAVGITNFLFLRVLATNTELNSPPSVAAWHLPFLAEIPVLGPMLFSLRPYVYVGIVMVIILTYMIYRTRWGLRLRASGEKPAAAGTVGIDVLKIRYRALLMAGLITGLAGSYLSLATAGSFQIQMTAGKGFIALAAMIFGAWHPVGAFAAAFVFGFADSAQAL